LLKRKADRFKRKPIAVIIFALELSENKKIIETTTNATML